jgi:hypothetical protein
MIDPPSTSMIAYTGFHLLPSEGGSMVPYFVRPGDGGVVRPEPLTPNTTITMAGSPWPGGTP